MELKIKYHDENMPKLKKISKGDWIDVCIVKGGTTVNGEKPNWELTKEGKAILKYKKGDFLMISTGLTIAPADGYEVYLAPRSSTFKNYGFILVNSIGIGDNSFRGNEDVYTLPMFALRDGEIELYDRVGQFRLHKCMEELNIIEVEDTGYDNRGGFGTTGTKAL